MKRLAVFAATLGPIGSSPIAPATAASFVVALVGWFLPVPPLPEAIGGILLLFAVGVWFCHEGEKVLGHDAKPIVFDELVGQSLALLLVPHHPLAFFGAFVLFRIFDVWKPLGAHQAQSLPGGLGIMMDDVIAGLTACGTFHLLRWAAARAGFAPF